MDILFLISAIIVILGGLMLLIAPKVMIRIGEAFNRMSATDDIILLKRHVIGVLLLFMGFYLLYTYLHI